MAKVRIAEGGRVSFWCPGCDGSHVISVAAGGWTWNGDVECPTFSPSVLVTGFVHGEGERRCHSYVRDGQIEFLADCTHQLAAQTVPLPPWPDPAH